MGIDWLILFQSSREKSHFEGGLLYNSAHKKKFSAGTPELEQGRGTILLRHGELMVEGYAIPLWLEAGDDGAFP